MSFTEAPLTFMIQPKEKRTCFENSPWNLYPAGSSSMTSAEDALEFDVIVVGSGIAGLSAAVTARKIGCRVAILERAPIEDRGGNTRWTEAFLRLKSEAAVSDDFITYLCP